MERVEEKKWWSTKRGKKMNLRMGIMKLDWILICNFEKREKYEMLVKVRKVMRDILGN